MLIHSLTQISLENEGASAENFILQPHNCKALKELFQHTNEHQLGYLLDSVSKMLAASPKICKELGNSESQVKTTTNT